MRKSKVPPLQPLLKFPLLVQIEIIKQMEPSEQYFLSKCSKRTYGSVKMSTLKKQNPEIWVHLESPSVRFYLKIANIKLPILNTDSREFREIHGYLCDLFSAPLEVYVKASCHHIELLIKPKFIPTGTIRKSVLPEVGYAGCLLNPFSKLHPNQDFISIDGSYTRHMLPGHTFHEAKNLMISNTGSYCPYSILSLFQGEHILIENGLISTFFLEVLVKKWMKSKMEKLKTAIVKLHSESVVEDLKFEKFSGRCRHYEYNSIIKGYHKFPNGIFDCSEGWEVTRETDGKMATIKITRDYFMFLVL